MGKLAVPVSPSLSVTVSIAVYVPAAVNVNEAVCPDDAPITVPAAFVMLQLYATRRAPAVFAGELDPSSVTGTLGMTTLIGAITAVGGVWLGRMI
jgi:hypothetical protein